MVQQRTTDRRLRRDLADPALTRADEGVGELLVLVQVADDDAGADADPVLAGLVDDRRVRQRLLDLIDPALDDGPVLLRGVVGSVFSKVLVSRCPRHGLDGGWQVSRFKLLELNLQLLEAGPRHVDRLHGHRTAKRLALGGTLALDLDVARKRDRYQLFGASVGEEGPQRLESAGRIDAGGRELVLEPLQLHGIDLGEAPFEAE